MSKNKFGKDASCGRFEVSKNVAKKLQGLQVISGPRVFLRCFLGRFLCIVLRLREKEMALG